MQTKLTLRLEERLIKNAKAWARSRGISLSQAVAGVFAQFPAADDSAPNLSPWARQLSGAGVVGHKPSPSDEELREEYVTYLEAKYQ